MGDRKPRERGRRECMGKGVKMDDEKQRREEWCVLVKKSEQGGLRVSKGGEEGAENG